MTQSHIGAVEDQDPRKSVQEMLDEAVKHHQSGRLAEAERVYRQILAIDANNADSYHLLGQISLQAGDLNSAEKLIEKAIRICGNIHVFHYSLGNVLATGGKIDAAASCYARAIELEPDHAAAHNNYGACFLKKGQFDNALPHFERAIECQPNFIDAYNNKGMALVNKGRFKEAVPCLRQAIKLKPDYAEALNNLGTALRALEDTGGELDPGDRGRPGEALACYEKAVAIKPDFAEAHFNIGIALKEIGKFEEAKKHFERAVALDPDYAGAHWNLALVMLTLGDFINGWRKYEWRWRRKGAEPHAFRKAPLWDGSGFMEKRILLHCEQGFGDNLHFIRYAPMVKERGGRVILACYEPLMRLFRDMPGIDQVFPINGTLPHYDVQAPLLSLPMIFGTTPETIPAEVPYLAAPLDQTEAWAERLRPYDGLKVGLVWAGYSRKDMAGERAASRSRSMKLDYFASLAGIPGIKWFSLQKDDPAQQAKMPPRGMEIIDLMNFVNDFADTAAFIANLDLVIGIDTSVTHVAGALARPTWVLSRFDGCWRHLLDREDSPWYPTMRLFRQAVPGEWEPVVEKVREALELEVERVKGIEPS